MATDEEMRKEADDLLCESHSELTSYDYIIKGIRKGIEIGKKEGIQMERERIRKKIGGLGIDKATGNIHCDDLDIWDDEK